MGLWNAYTVIYHINALQTTKKQVRKQPKLFEKVCFFVV